MWHPLRESTELGRPGEALPIREGARGDDLRGRMHLADVTRRLENQLEPFHHFLRLLVGWRGSICFVRFLVG